MEAVLLSIPVFSSSKAPKPNPFAPPSNRTFSKCNIRSSLRASNFRQSKVFFSISLSAVLSQDQAASAPVSHGSATASSSFRALASGGGADRINGDTESKDVLDSSAGEIILDITGMMCDGCVSSVTRILESQPQVSFAKVSLHTATAVVCATPDAQLMQNWQKDLGDKLANHLTNCGFKSNLRG